MAVESPMNRLNEPRQIGAVNWRGGDLWLQVLTATRPWNILSSYFLCKEIPSDVSHEKLRQPTLEKECSRKNCSDTKTEIHHMWKVKIIPRGRYHNLHHNHNNPHCTAGWIYCESSFFLYKYIIHSCMKFLHSKMFKQCIQQELQLWRQESYSWYDTITIQWFCN